MAIRYLLYLLVIVVCIVSSVGTMRSQVPLQITKPMSPPEWAFMERALLLESARLFEKYADKYINPNTGYMEIVENWGGIDGPDDVMENWYNCSLLYALGAPKSTLDLFNFIWNGHIDQFTELGMYYKEFVTSFDWEHTGEGIAPFLLLPISDPEDWRTQDRIVRFADFYTGRDTSAHNYDPEHKIIRSIHNGSKGVRLTATVEDWGGPRADREFWEEWTREMRGDVPINFLTTSLVLNAYILTGDEHYKNWIEEYMGAWAERTIANGGMIPTIVGLSGKVGEGWGGNWYGGMMGWDFSFGGWFILGRGMRVGFNNAYFASGSLDFLNVLRKQGELLLENRERQADGRMFFRNKFGGSGWYDLIRIPSHQSAFFEALFADIYLWSLEKEDLNRFYDACQLDDSRRRNERNWVYEYEGQFDGGNEVTWIDFLQGNYPDYPEKILDDSFERTRLSAERLRNDNSTEDERQSDSPHRKGIKVTSAALVNLTMGGAVPLWSGALLYCQLRYFDPDRRRPGLPDDVAALVTKITKEYVQVVLVNINQTESRDIIVQTGAYGENQITRVEYNGKTFPVNKRYFPARLAPGAGAEFTIYRNRFVNKPTFAFPWHGDRVPVQ